MNKEKQQKKNWLAFYEWAIIWQNNQLLLRLLMFILKTIYNWLDIREISTDKLE